MPILKSSKTLVFDLINAANPHLPIKLAGNNCQLEKITPVTPGPTNGFRNTSVRIRGIQGEGFEDQFTLFYDRLKLSQVILPVAAGKAAGSKFVTYSANTFHKALPVISLAYGVELATWDIADGSLPGANTPNYTTLVTMTAHAASPAYTGTVVVRIDRGKPLLEEGITVQTINPLIHPVDPSENKLSVAMVTWGLDFTAYRTALTVTAGGMPNWAELRAVLDELGIPPYSAPADGNQVSDMATSAVTDANKDYDRVVVQTGIDATGIKGAAYYHYNT